MSKKEQEAAIRAGFQIAWDHAEISTWDGWNVCSPHIDWESARKKLEEAIAKLGEKK